MECLSLLEKISEKLNIPNILLYNSYRKFSKAQSIIQRLLRTFPPKRLEETDVVIFGYLLQHLNIEEITEKELYSLWWLITAHYTDDNPYGTWWIARGLRMDKHEFDNNCVNLSLKLSCPLLKIVNNEVYSKEYKEILLH
jgi:hypothetical protein